MSVLYTSETRKQDGWWVHDLDHAVVCLDQGHWALKTLVDVRVSWRLFPPCLTSPAVNLHREFQTIEIRQMISREAGPAQTYNVVKRNV